MSRRPGVPIFVDERGRRTRVWQFVVVVIGFLGVAYLALAGTSLMSGGSFSGLPWPSQTHPSDARAGRRPGPESASFVVHGPWQPARAHVAAATALSAAAPVPGAGAVTPANSLPVMGAASPTAASITGSALSQSSNPPSTTAGTVARGRSTSATAATTGTTAPGQTTKTTAPGQTTKTTSPGQTTKTTAPGLSVEGSTPGSNR